MSLARENFRGRDRERERKKEPDEQSEMEFFVCLVLTGSKKKKEKFAAFCAGNVDHPKFHFVLISFYKLFWQRRERTSPKFFSLQLI